MIKKLDDVCDFLSGNAWKASSFQDSGIPIIRINNMNFNDNDFVYWQDVYDKKYLINKDDLLLSLSGTIKTFKWNGPEALLNQRIVKITPKKNQDVNIDWIYYQLHYAIEIIANKGKHAVIRNVSINDLKKFEIDIPEIQVQNKIVLILDKAISLVVKRERSITILEDLLKSTFLKMFGKQNPSFENWEEVEVQALAKSKKGSMRTGPFGSSLKHEEFDEEGDVAVLGIDNAVNNIFKWGKKRFLTTEKYENFKQYTVYPRDVIITIMGTVGRSAVIPTDIGKAINTKHLAAITLDETKCNPYYLAYSIHSNPFVAYQMKAKSRGAIMAGFNLGLIKKLKLKAAPIGLQNEFEIIYLQNKASLEILSKSKLQLDNLFNSTIQKVFNGQLNFNVDFELDALIREIDLQRKQNDLSKIVGDISYLQRLVDKLNSQEFKEKDLYDKAKHGVFQLMTVKEEERKVFQEYDENSKSIKLALR